MYYLSHEKSYEQCFTNLRYEKGNFIITVIHVIENKLIKISIAILD